MKKVSVRTEAAAPPVANPPHSDYALRDRVLGVALEAALAASGAAASQLLIPGANGTLVRILERISATCEAGIIPPLPFPAEAQSAGSHLGDDVSMMVTPEWSIATVPVMLPDGSMHGAALLAYVPGVIPDCRLLRCLGRQLGAAFEQLRLFQAERRRIEADLRSVEQRNFAQAAQIHAIVAQAAEAIYVCDAVGMIILANQPAAEMFGLPDPSAMLRPVGDLAHLVEIRTPTGKRMGPDDLLLHRALTQRKVEKGEYAIRNPQSGQESYRRVSAAPLTGLDGEIQGAVAVASDISTLVELQQLSEVEAAAATLQRQRLQAIIDALADPICVFDASWRVLLVNRRLIQTLGLPENVVGRHATELDDLVPGRFVQMESTELMTSLAQRILAGKVDEVTAGDPPRVFRRAGSGVYDDSGEPLAYIFLYHDITPLREVERLKDEFLATVSHDLRSPLHHIKGYATTLLREDVSWDPATQRSFLTIIDRESDRMTRLVSNLLDLSRLETADTQWLQLGVCDVAAFVNGAVERVRDALEKHVIEVDLAPDLPPIDGDPRWLEQLIANLLDNAAKYSPDSTPIRIRGTANDSDVRLSVMDAGIGIPAEHLESIFGRFYRVPNQHRIRGSGLGLAICRRIAEAHGGRIWAESVINHGSVFHVELPRGRR